MTATLVDPLPLTEEWVYDPTAPRWRAIARLLRHHAPCGCSTCQLVHELALAIAAYDAPTKRTR